MSDLPELKPCPFCGSKVVWDCFGDEEDFVPACTNSECYAFTPQGDNGIERFAMATLWNTRVDHIRSPEAEVYWRERIAQELEVGEAMKASALGPFYRTFTSAAAFVRGNKRERQ